jgi:hypothetical protein
MKSKNLSLLFRPERCEFKPSEFREEWQERALLSSDYHSGTVANLETCKIAAEVTLRTCWAFIPVVHYEHDPHTDSARRIQKLGRR